MTEGQDRQMVREIGLHDSPDCCGVVWLLADGASGCGECGQVEDWLPVRRIVEPTGIAEAVAQMLPTDAQSIVYGPGGELDRLRAALRSPEGWPTVIEVPSEQDGKAGPHTSAHEDLGTTAQWRSAAAYMRQLQALIGAAKRELDAVQIDSSTTDERFSLALDATRLEFHRYREALEGAGGAQAAGSASQGPDGPAGA